MLLKMEIHTAIVKEFHRLSFPPFLSIGEVHRRMSRIRKHSWQYKDTIIHQHKTLFSYSRGVVENPHAICVDEGLPAQLDVGDVFDATQNALANEHVSVARVIAVPVLIDGEQNWHVSPVYCSPGIHL